MSEPRAGGIIIRYKSAVGSKAAVLAIVASAGASAAAFVAALLFHVEAEDGNEEHHYRKEHNPTLYVHSIMETSQATSQATRHWVMTMMSAQRLPNSRRTVAMAATQGV